MVVSAYGVADAEHLVEKELAHLWPEGIVRIEEISRVGPSRIVEEFEIAYRLEGVVEVEEATEATGRAAAFRQLRRRLRGSRYERIENRE